MKTNLDYFEYCSKHPEGIFDETFLFLDKNPRLSEYVQNIKEIKDLLTTLKCMLQKKEKEEILEKYFQALQQHLCCYSNCSEFVCFAHACDTSLEHLKKDYDLLKKVTRLYLKKRDLTDLTPVEWVQAILDSHSSRRKGAAGENKLKNICKELGFVPLSNWSELEKESLAFASFSKKPTKDFGLDTVRKKLQITLRMNDPHKAPDLLIKKGKKWLIIEAKHINTSGGEQNKQIQELIDLLAIQEKQKDIYYIAFMDGQYSNKILNPCTRRKGAKVLSQYQQILQNLKKHPNSYWLNTAGFLKFIREI